jgi:hypothetical protein
MKLTLVENIEDFRSYGDGLFTKTTEFLVQPPAMKIFIAFISSERNRRSFLIPG